MARLTYLILDGAMLLAIGWAVRGLRQRRMGSPQVGRRLLGIVTVMLLLTAVFDTLLIMLDMFHYNSARIIGWRLGLAPIEDFAYPLAVVPLMVYLWRKFGGDDA